jgi:hypothetical protein
MAQRSGALELWGLEPRAISCDVGIVTARWDGLRDKVVAGRDEAMNELRSPSPQL